jgi:hypothetical protein
MEKRRNATPPTDSTRLEAVAICRRLERDYSDSFAAAGASGVDAWANAAQIGVETRFGERSGSIWATTFGIADEAASWIVRAVGSSQDTQRGRASAAD